VYPHCEHFPTWMLNLLHPHFRHVFQIFLTFAMRQTLLPYGTSVNEDASVCADAERAKPSGSAGDLKWHVGTV